MNRKAQVTVYILLALILLIGFGFVFYLQSSEVKQAEIKKISELPLNFVPIKNYVESCIQNVGKDGILLIGKRGGYVNLPKYNTQYFIIKTAYYFYLDKDIIPSKNRLEQELSEYMNEELFFCIRNFVDFKEVGFNIEQEVVNIKATINPNNIIFKVNFPVTIKKGTSEIKLDYFAKSIDNIRLGIIYNVSNAIINEQMKDFSSICLSCLINLAIENDLHIDMNRLSNDTILFTITDFNSKIDNLPLKYIFANKYAQVSCTNIPYDWPEKKVNDLLLSCLKSRIEEFDYTLKINGISDLNAIVNVPFIYDVNVTGFNVTYSDFTNLFEINNKTGLINFTPMSDQIGSYTIWIRASDSLGNEDFESFELNIVNSS